MNTSANPQTHDTPPDFALSSEEALLPVFTARNYFHAASYYYRTCAVFPCKRLIINVGFSELLTALIKEFKVDEHTVIRYDSVGKDFTNIIQAYVPLRPDFAVHFRRDERNVEILYSPATAGKLLEEVAAFILRFEDTPVYGRVYLVTNPGNHLCLDDFPIERPSVNLELHYNDDFGGIHNIIMNGLSLKREKGLILLHGIPGSGKTTYLRHLITNVDRRFIYLPTELAHMIAEPIFLNFISGYPNSILLIEDAEEILAPRNGKGNSAIGNLLNLGDGLLSDCLKIQVICTFNAPLTRIDPALLRKGRIIANYEFKALDTGKANRLIAMNGKSKTFSTPVSLAEIFHAEDEDFGNQNSKAIGFLVEA